MKILLEDFEVVKFFQFHLLKQFHSKLIEQNNILNTAFDSFSSESHYDGQNNPSQVETNQQISKLQDEMNQFKTILIALTQQVIPRSEEGDASRA